MTTATVTRIHPPGSTLTRASGAPVTVGDRVEDGAVLTMATPDGAPGCISLSARGVRLDVRTVRAAVEVAPPVAVEVAPATLRPVDAPALSTEHTEEIV